MSARFIRSTFVSLLLIAMAGFCAAGDLAAGWVPSETLSRIRAAEAAGEISADEAALNRIYRIFDGERVDPRFRVEGDRPGKCATGEIEDILMSDKVSEAVKSILRDYIDAPGGGDRELYISPDGWFRLTYATSGGNGVPAADDDGSGVPDFVEWCADYLDYSWQREITELGFYPPVFIPNVDYAINFQALSGAYGYTTNLGGGRSRITLDNDFYGFPANDDPDGDQKGAAKVTCAHEFKHASQIGTTFGIDASQWKELDATWMEEIVFPATNDYRWYVNYPGSPLRNPEQSLDYITQGGYEDCIWQHYMSGTHGDEIIVRLWELRDELPIGNFYVSYDDVLQEYGSSLSEAWGLWTRWNYFTGSRAIAGHGYDDANILYTCFTIMNQAQLPVNPVNMPVNHMAVRYGRHYNLSGYDQWPKVIIDGDAGVDWRCQAVVKKTDASLVFYALETDEAGACELILNEPFNVISEIGIAMANADWAGDGNWCSYDIEQDINTNVDGGIPGYGLMRLHPNYPNPFNPSTALKFELAAPAAVTLRVHTPSGRVLRRLLEAVPHGQGTHELIFDGKDDAGSDLPSGVYFAALDINGASTQLVKMTLLK